MSTSSIATPNLVIKHDGEFATTSEIIAANTDNEHASVMKLVRDYQGQIEQFGPCRFEIAVVKRPQGGGTSREVAILNEQQSTFLLTLMRNSEVVVRFKLELVREFYRLRSAQFPQVSDPRTAALIESLVRFDQLEQQQKVLQAQTAALTNRLDQIETAQTHFTVVGYMNTVAHKSVPLTEASTIGRRATKLCKERDLDIGSVPDPRFGRANTYPKHILDEVTGDIVADLT